MLPPQEFTVPRKPGAVFEFSFCFCSFSKACLFGKMGKGADGPCDHSPAFFQLFKLRSAFCKLASAIFIGLADAQAGLTGVEDACSASESLLLF